MPLKTHIKVIFLKLNILWNTVTSQSDHSFLWIFRLFQSFAPSNGPMNHEKSQSVLWFRMISFVHVFSSRIIASKGPNFFRIWIRTEEPLLKQLDHICTDHSMWTREAPGAGNVALVCWFERCEVRSISSVAWICMPLITPETELPLLIWISMGLFLSFGGRDAAWKGACLHAQLGPPPPTRSPLGSSGLTRWQPCVLWPPT